MNNNIIRKTVHFLQKTYEYQKNSNVDGAQIITFYGGEPLLNFAGIKTFIEEVNKLKVGSINSIFYFLHKAAEPFNCLEQDNLA